MTEDEARHVELLRAIEMEDREAVLLTGEDRAQADANARAASSSFNGQRAATAFIASRAAFASARLATRHPGVSSLLARSHWPKWIGIAVPLLALVAGFVANEFGTGKRLDLLAVPLLGTIAWNWFVYSWIVVASVKSGSGKGLNLFYRAVGRVAGLGQRHFDQGSALNRAAATFERRWASAAVPLTGARIGRTMHLGAALFAVGLIAGIYLRALVIEYRAGWESTFLGPAAVRGLLSATLGPASWLTGRPIPDVAGIAAMRWTGPFTGGVNAGPWIILYTVTVVALVVVPRLLLASWHGADALRLARRFPVAGREDFYIRRLLRNAGAAPGVARVTPYAYRPGDETRRRVAAALRAALGDGAEVQFDEPIEYGEEDRWLRDHPASGDEDYHVLLFTLSATPEEENHGALASALADRAARDRSGTILAAASGTGVARGFNLAKGDDRSSVRWSKELLERLTVTALLRYLAVAHFGRGRGEWSESEHPAFWQSLVEQVVAKRKGDLATLLKGAAAGPVDRSEESTQGLASLLKELGTVALDRLYPDTRPRTAPGP